MQRHALNDANEMDLFESFSETMKNSDFTSLTNFNNSVAQNNKPIPTATMEVQNPVKAKSQRILKHIIILVIFESNPLILTSYLLA